MDHNEQLLWSCKVVGDNFNEITSMYLRGYSVGMNYSGLAVGHYFNVKQ